MLRIALAVALGFGAITLSVAGGALAQDKKDEKKTLEGTLTCTKCALGETKACGHALIVKEGDKKVNYYLVDKGGKEPYHKNVCTQDAEAKVTGKVGEKDGKKTISEPKVEIKK
jgi:RecG-like helicase